jgi:hypothetical protein
MALLDVNALGAVLKQKYSTRKVNSLGYNKRPFWAMVKKVTDFDGDTYVEAVQYGQPQGRSHDMSRADANITPSQYKRFTLTRAKDYGLFGITTEAIRAAKSDTGAMIKSLSKEIDGAVLALTRNMAQEIYRNGGAARAQGSSVSSAVLTLTKAADVAQFEYGMTVRASTADGTSGTLEAGSVQITGLDRDAGTLTANVNWTTGITGFAGTEYIFQDGDFGLGLKGLLGWLPTTAPSAGESFFGTDRSVDATRLGGVRVTGSGGPIEETLIEAHARLLREESSPDVCFMNPLDWANFAKAISSRTIYERASRPSFDDPAIDFATIRMAGGIDIIADVNCPKGNAFMLQMDTWTFHSLGQAPGIIDEDGLTFVRNPTSDDYKGRVGYYGNLGCNAPGWNAVITF